MSQYTYIYLKQVNIFFGGGIFGFDWAKKQGKTLIRLIKYAKKIGQKKVERPCENVFIGYNSEFCDL